MVHNYTILIYDDSVKIAELNTAKPITELFDEEKRDILRWLARKVEGWDEVLNGNRRAVVFNAETLDQITFN